MTAGLLLILLAPATLWAQGELTLEGVAALAGLTERVARLEALFEGPGAVEVDETTCSIGRPGDLQDETVMRYKEQFDEWVEMDEVWFVDMRQSIESGHTIVVYADDHPAYADWFVAETWDGCTFVGASDWYWREAE